MSSILTMPRRAEPALHIRFQGRSLDVSLHGVSLALDSTDAEVHAAAARFLEVAPAEIKDYVVDRSENGLTLRPSAVFG